MRRLITVLLVLASAAPCRYDAPGVGSQWLIAGYRGLISPLQGGGMCNFWPTCSQFTRQAIEEHGLAAGVVIGADRLVRCHGYAWDYFGSFYRGISRDRMNDPVTDHLAWQAPADPPPGAAGLGAAVPRPVRTDPASGDPTAFADFLYADGDFGRSGTEYLRVRFSTADVGVRDYAGLMAGESFLQAGDFDRARTVFGGLAAGSCDDLVHYGSARTWFAQGEHDAARRALDSVATPRLAHRRLVLAGWMLLREYRFRAAAALFALDPASAPLAALDGAGRPGRSRLAATLLSALVPGAGQFYSGRTADGALSLLTVAGTGLLTWWYAANPEHDRTRVKLGIAASLTALFYAGTVYGANIAARDYNRLADRRYLSLAEGRLDDLDLRPDYRVLLGVPAGDSVPGQGPPEN